MAIKSCRPLLAFLLLAGAPVASLMVEYPKPHNHSQPAKPQERDTERRESFAPIGTIGNHGEGKQEASWQAYFDKPTDWILAAFTGMLVLYTRRLYVATAGLFVETKGLREAADSQKLDMAHSIREAARAATAMEGVVKGIERTVATNENVLETQRDFWSRQMRAYISVDIGGYIRQNRRKNIKFEFRPNIINNGATPANFVKVFARCDIKTINIPIDFDFSINNDHHNAPGSATIFSRVSKFKSTVFERFASRQELAGLLKGKLIFHVWGTVFYEDIFGADRSSNFSFVIFMPNNKRGNPIWQTTERHNDAD
jgi:hypothetical protein